MIQFDTQMVLFRMSHGAWFFSCTIGMDIADFMYVISDWSMNSVFNIFSSGVGLRKMGGLTVTYFKEWLGPWPFVIDNKGCIDCPRGM